MHNKGWKRFMGQSEIKCLFSDAIFNVTNKVRKRRKKLDRHTAVDNLKGFKHGLRTPNEGINQRNLKNWAVVADKICFGRT